MGSRTAQDVQENDLRSHPADGFGHCCQHFAIWLRGLRESDLERHTRRQKGAAAPFLFTPCNFVLC